MIGSEILVGKSAFQRTIAFSRNGWAGAETYTWERRKMGEYDVNVSRSNAYSGSTAAPWYGKAKVCIDISLSPDTCNAYSASGRIS